MIILPSTEPVAMPPKQIDLELVLKCSLVVGVAFISFIFWCVENARRNPRDRDRVFQFILR